MNDNAPPPRKKLGLPSASAIPAAQIAPKKRGVRVRGGAPAAFRAPVFDPNAPPAPVRPSRPPARSFDDSRPPRKFDGSRPPRPFDDSRPPRKFDDTRPPPRDRGSFGADSRPPRKFDDTRPARPFDDSRPPRKFDDTRLPPRDRNTSGADSRPPRKFDDARPPRERFERGDRDAPRGGRSDADRPPFRREPPVQPSANPGFETVGLHTFFATCPRGLEQVLREELLQLGAAGIEVTPGGAMFKGAFARGLAVNLESRVASRVMWKLAEDNYACEDDIYNLARKLDWPVAFPVDQTIKVQVTAIFSPLKSIDFIALKVKDAICDAFRDAIGSRPNVDTSMPNQRIHVFLNRNTVTLYLDVSGEALFKRGYRRDGLIAPIRENLAAGILRLVGWKPHIPLLDPMCGSGTFITEALLIAMDAAPGLRRRNAHERWSMHPMDEFHAMKDAARARIKLPEELRLFARDSSEEAVQQTRAHVAALGGTAALDHRVCDALELDAPCEHGMIMANPPYGVRLGSTDELAAMYPQFATLLKQKFGGWEASFITADLTMPEGLSMSPTRKLPLRNGALDCRLFTFPINIRNSA